MVVYKLVQYKDEIPEFHYLGFPDANHIDEAVEYCDIIYGPDYPIHIYEMGFGDHQEEPNAAFIPGSGWIINR